MRRGSGVDGVGRGCERSWHGGMGEVNDGGVREGERKGWIGTRGGRKKSLNIKNDPHQNVQTLRKNFQAFNK